MNTTKLTREEALRRWNASKETKRKMVEKLEILVRNSCLERTGKELIEIVFTLHLLFSISYCRFYYAVWTANW